MFVKTIIALSLAILAVAAPGPQPQGFLGTPGVLGQRPNDGQPPNSHRDLSGGRIAARAPQPQGLVSNLNEVVGHRDLGRTLNNLAGGAGPL
ncbi:hypothetical protein BJV78DRAFT_1253855, partial [Lactifluus subvellereus]